MKIICLTAMLVVASFSVTAQVKTGQQAPDISLPDTKDSMISLSSFKGKVVLIDFWASWCGPCRASNPGVVRLYQKYKDKGFEVFGISIDSKKAAWIKAIRDDRIKYTQVNDAAGWDSKAAALYNVDAIPATFLLDKKGVIIAVNPEGKQLEHKIKALLQE